MTIKKRKLFDELMEGVDAMRQQREGKITLRPLDHQNSSAASWNSAS